MYLEYPERKVNSYIVKYLEINIGNSFLRETKVLKIWKYECGHQHHKVVSRTSSVATRCYSTTLVGGL